MSLCFVGPKLTIKFADSLKRLTRLNSRLYSWLSFSRAKIDRPRATGKICESGGIERGQAHAFEYFPIWDHLEHAFSLATN